MTHDGAVSAGFALPQTSLPSCVLVTGASGFLGAHIIANLRASFPSIEVVGLIRRPEQSAALTALGAHACVGSLAAPKTLVQALDGIDAIVHCAGGGEVVHLREMFEKNTDTTRALLDAIDLASASQIKPQIKRFILISSLSAHGPAGPDAQPRLEDAPPRPTSTYGRSKLAAERLVLERAQHLPVTILRPPAIYGPHDRRWLPLFRAARRGIVPLIAGHRSASLVSGEDCARAVTHLLTHAHPSGWVGCVEDGQPLTWPQIAQTLGDAVQTRPWIFPVPPAVLSIAAHLNQRWATHTQRPTPFNSDKFQDMRQTHWVCRAQNLRALGWQPSTSFSDGGARLTAQWYREHGLL